jgi:Plasmid recombination enzyme
MSNFAILRYDRRSLSTAAAMARHALRAGRVENADPARSGDNQVLIGAHTPAGVMGAIRAKLPADRRHNAVPCIELFVGASPEAMHKLSRKDQDSYMRGALEWIGREFGGQANIVSAVIHRDESTPHMQVLLVPLLDGTLNAKKLIGNRNAMKDRQTRFAQVCGKPYGLRRGEEGSKAKHTSIRAFYGAIEAAGSRNALPPARPVPAPLDEPGVFSSKAAKDAYAKREKERAEAMEANRKRQAEIVRLAKVGLAVKGKPTRTLPEAQTELERAQAEAARARQVVADGRQAYNATDAKRQELQAQIDRLTSQRDTIARQLDQLNDATTPAAIRATQRPQR